MNEPRDFERNASYIFRETLTLSRAICIREFASETRFPLRISCGTASCTKKLQDNSSCKMSGGTIRYDTIRCKLISLNKYSESSRSLNLILNHSAA